MKNLLLIWQYYWIWYYDLHIWFGIDFFLLGALPDTTLTILSRLRMAYPGLCIHQWLGSHPGTSVLPRDKSRWGLNSQSCGQQTTNSTSWATSAPREFVICDYHDNSVLEADIFGGVAYPQNQVSSVQIGCSHHSIAHIVGGSMAYLLGNFANAAIHCKPEARSSESVFPTSNRCDCEWICSGKHGHLQETDNDVSELHKQLQQLV